VLFGDPDLDAALHDAPTPTDEGTDAAPLDHLRGVIFDQEAEYLSLAPFGRHRPGPHDEGGADA